jgi:hypothetical protein
MSETNEQTLALSVQQLYSVMITPWNHHTVRDVITSRSPLSQPKFELRTLAKFLPTRRLTRNAAIESVCRFAFPRYLATV